MLYQSMFFPIIPLWLLVSASSVRASLRHSRKLRRVEGNLAIDQQYLVILHGQKPSQSVESLRKRRLLVGASTNDSPVGMVTVRGLNDYDLLNLINDDAVAFVEQDQYISLASLLLDPSSSPMSLSWGLDRLDQQQNELDNRFQSSYTGKGVEVFVLDSGLRQTHQEFRTDQTVCSFNALPNQTDTGDCSDSTGHGTHVSSIIGGHTMGVAPDVRLNMVKVVNETGSGPLSSTIQGIQHVIEKQIASNRTMVLNISLGSIQSDAFVLAVERAVEYGVVVVMAAGNEGGSACQWSAGQAKTAISVGATTRSDRITKFSNYGSCVDLFAPGDDIPGASFKENSEYVTLSGTSQAAPFVSGVAALYLEQWPTLTPQQVATFIERDGIKGALHTNWLHYFSDTPNLLLNTQKLT